MLTGKSFGSSKRNSLAGSTYGVLYQLGMYWKHFTRGEAGSQLTHLGMQQHEERGTKRHLVAAATSDSSDVSAVLAVISKISL